MKKSKTITGVKWTALSSLVIVVVQTLQIIIVSRFLTKEEFGLASLVLVMSGFAQIFIDFGVSNALISKKEISKKEIDGLFWLTLIISFIVFVLLNVLAPLISKFYGIKEISNLILILSLSILFSGVSSLYRSLKQRNLNFNYMAIMDVFGVVLGLIISSFFAYNGGGAYSLIVAISISSFFISILYLINGVSEFGFPRSFIEKLDLKYYIRFGIFQLGEKFFIYFNSQIDLIIIGKTMNADMVGIYSIAKQLSMKVSTFFNSIISRITLPILAKVNRDADNIKIQYINTVSILTFFLAPVFGLVIINSEIIIKVLFGEKWFDVIPILNILCVYMYFRIAGSPVGSLLLVFNKPHYTFYWNFISFFIFSPLVIYFSLKGLYILCVFLVVYSILIKIPEYFLLVNKVISMNFFSYILNIFTSFMVALFSYLLVKAFDITLFYVSSVLFLILYVITSVLLNFRVLKFIFQSLRLV